MAKKIRQIDIIDNNSENIKPSNIDQKSANNFKLNISK